ncbi:MAG: cytochrome P450 [Sphingomonadales bacterium]|nr:cytochrome P450 [Sphingomonadales bacterium]
MAPTEQAPVQTLTDLPYLDVTAPGFSIRAPEVMAARDASWAARTPYGLAVLRYDDVQKLLRHPKLRQGSYRWPALNGVTGVFARWWEAMLLSQEGETHARLRRMANPAFSPKLITDLRPKFEALANRLIDGFAARGECDFIAEFTEPYATGVICDLLGLPFEKWRELADIAGEMGLALGVTFKDDLPVIEAATARLFAYAEELVALRRAEPSEDFIGMLVAAGDRDGAISEQEVLDMIVLAIFGGIDTTRNQLGLAMATFIEHPEQWALLAEQPDLARAAVEEVMRVRPTVTWVTREATEEFLWNDLPIAAGTTIHLFSQAATSDPAVFPDPGFDITAERKPHFGFGGGTHHCLGHFIARGDMTEALKLLARRLKNPRMNGAAEWLPDSGNTGAVRLPIAFDPA